jgi:arginine/serine-rich coiled-coil protein 2
MKTVQSVAQWTGSSFAADSDGKVAAKFRKLMGIKEEDKMLLADNLDISKLSEEQRRRQDELFQQLDKEYAFARMTTHTHRGIGLGFQSQGLPDP